MISIEKRENENSPKIGIDGNSRQSPIQKWREE
jgi:hypothetical protein